MRYPDPRILLICLGLLWLAACAAAETPLSPSRTPKPATLTPPAPRAAATSLAPEATMAAEATLQDLFLRPTTIAVTVTATPPPSPRELVVCQAAEPDSLYLYGSNMLDGQNVRHALIEPLLTQRRYGYQAHGLEKLPQLDQGDATIAPVTVQAGDRVVDVSGAAVTLAAGVNVRTSAGQTITFDGAPLQLPQMSVTFTLRPLVWSDGTPMTAADSVFSYEINAATEPPFGAPAPNADRLARTAAYQATGDRTVRWTGLPGFLDQTYFLNVWEPLPRHQLAGQTAAELLADEMVARRPLATGPFMVDAWQPGSTIRVVRNPHYYRQAAGLPYLDAVTFRFVPDPDQVLADLLSGKCHLATASSLSVAQAPLLLQAKESGLLAPQFQAGTVFEHLDFGIDSAGAYGDGQGRPDWFQDARVRRALALCTDRPRLVDEILFGQAPVLDAYVPAAHPLYPADLPVWPYDVAAGNALLDEAGWLDVNGNGVRQDPATGAPFRLTLTSSAGGELRPAIFARLRDSWRDCGVQLEADWLPADEMFAPGPEGPVLGRRFDVALFAWSTGSEPPCHLWLSDNITGSVADGLGGWDNVNVTGWANAEFDAACRQAQISFPGSPEHAAAHRTALRLFAAELPVIPLFPRLQVAAARPEVRGFRLDPTQPSALWNLFEIDLARP